MRLLKDGRLELDTNPVENQIRPIALTRRNALFPGHEVGAENWATLASLIATCKTSDVKATDYIARTMRAILDGHPGRRIEELMPRISIRGQTSPRRASPKRLLATASRASMMVGSRAELSSSIAALAVV